MKKFAILVGLALFTLIILAGCSKTQELTTKQIDEVNVAFETLIPADTGNIANISGLDGEILNPVSHFFTSYYETPEQMDMGAFVYYILRETFLSPTNDEAEIAALQEAYANLSVDTILASVPFGRIPYATVNQYLQTYMNLTLEDMTNMSMAVYLEEYETFYSSASDFGPGAFYCTNGEITGDVVTLYSDHAILTLKKDGENYFIVSHIAKSPVNSPELVPIDPILQVYCYLPDSKLYEKQEAGAVPPTLHGVVQAVAKTLALPDPQVIAITQQKGTVSIDFAKTLLEQYSKQEVYRFLDSIGMTLSKNHRGFETVVYTIDGEGGSLVGDSPWSIQPLKLMEGDAAAYKAMRDTTAYSRSNMVYNADAQMQTLNTDPTAKAIADLLSAADIADLAFEAPAAIPPVRVVTASIGMTQSFARAGSLSYPGYPIGDAMEPIYAAVSLKLDMQEDLVWVQEHMAQSAKLLYGPDFAIEHQTAGKYKYFPEEGVYTPPHMGGGRDILTAVLDYTDNGKTVTATVSYAMAGMPGLAVIGDWEKIIAPEKLVDHLKNDAVQRIVTLRKNTDGSLYILTQQPK